MTANSKVEFQARVAAALSNTLLNAGWGQYPVEPIATELAPYVAAAIEVALRADYAHRGSYDAALRELKRGE